MNVAWGTYGSLGARSGVRGSRRSLEKDRKAALRLVKLEYKDTIAAIREDAIAKHQALYDRAATEGNQPRAHMQIEFDARRAVAAARTERDTKLRERETQFDRMRYEVTMIPMRSRLGIQDPDAEPMLEEMPVEEGPPIAPILGGLALVALMLGGAYMYRQQA